MGARSSRHYSGDDTYDASRASELLDHARDGVEGIITTIGAKYTTARALAAKTTAHVVKRLGLSARAARTDRAPLDCCGVGNLADAVERTRAAWPQLSEVTISQLLRFYGTANEEVLGLTRERPELGEPLNAEGEILAQAVCAVRNEAAVHLTDVLLRRTGFGTLGDPPDGANVCHMDFHPGNVLLESGDYEAY